MIQYLENIDKLKTNVGTKPRYRLSNANVFVSSDGFHYIDYLDPIEDISPEIDTTALTENEIAYIESSLQSNKERFENQVNAVKRYIDIKSKKVLDIGCGGGLFLSKMREQGADVVGIELSDSRAHYCISRHNIKIVKRPVEDDYWKKYAESFDVVTLWDVIEHVNYPHATLVAATKLLKPGGLLLIDTPCRDAFYHRVGVFTYRLSRGKFPTFLNAMYSARRFGHKQIFATFEVRRLFEMIGVSVLELNKFHELSFPNRFYLKKLLKSDVMVGLTLPLVSMALSIFPIRNKMLAIGKKTVV